MKPWYTKARELMQLREISTQDLADALGVTAPAARHYLNGTRNPKPGALGKISKRLGVSMSELTEDDPRFARDKSEEKMLDLVRELDPHTKEVALRMLEGLGAPHTPPNHEDD